MNSFLIFLLAFSYFPLICLAQSQLTLSNIQISFANNGTHTDFTLVSALSGSVANSWMAVGLNNAGQMVYLFLSEIETVFFLFIFVSKCKIKRSAPVQSFVEILYQNRASQAFSITIILGSSLPETWPA